MKLAAAVVVGILFLPAFAILTWFLLLFPTLHLNRGCVQPIVRVGERFPPLNLWLERVWDWFGIDSRNYR